MPSLYNNPEYVAHLPKTGFNMTQPVKFSSTMGQLVPVFCDFMQPGERYHGHVEMFSRTRELETAAMADIDEYIDYFFVPAEKLSQIFGEWFFGIDDRKSALRPETLPARAETLPNISAVTLRNFFSSVVTSENNASISQDLYGFDFFGSGMVRLMQHFRFDVFKLFDSSSSSASDLWNIPLLPFMAYQAIYYDYFRDTNWQNNDVLAYNFDDWLTGFDIESDVSYGTSAYERLKKIFQIHYRRQNADYFNNVKPSPLQNATGMLRFDNGDSGQQLLLRVNQWLQGTGINFDFQNYQGFEVMPTSVNAVASSIVDGDGSGYADIETAGIRSKRTTLTGMSALNSYIPNTSDVNNFASHQHNIFPSGSAVQSQQLLSENATLVNADLSFLAESVKQSINTATIRTMFALEKLAKVTGRAGKHYDDQVLAHFGFKVPRGFTGDVMHLGQQHGQIHIGEVISPSTIPDGSVAGEIVGKGYGNMNGGDIDFTAPVHGYFMAIYSSAPQRNYTPCGSPKEYSQFRREDFPIPEFMNLGMQPLFTDEFTRTSNYAPVQLWQWRYSEMKTRIPMAIGAFSNFYHRGNGQSVVDTTLNGALQDWTINYPILNTLPSYQNVTLTYRNFLVAPTSLNSIMTLQYNGYHSLPTAYHVARVFDRDPLFHALVNKFSKTSWMTTFGEERID